MACHSERSESSEMPAIAQCNQAEWDNDQQDGFFVDVPTKEEGSKGAEGGSRDEVVPCRSEE